MLLCKILKVIASLYESFFSSYVGQILFANTGLLSLRLRNFLILGVVLLLNGVHVSLCMDRMDADMFNDVHDANLELWLNDYFRMATPEQAIWKKR